LSSLMHSHSAKQTSENNGGTTGAWTVRCSLNVRKEWWGLRLRVFSYQLTRGGREQNMAVSGDIRTDDLRGAGTILSASKDALPPLGGWVAYVRRNHHRTDRHDLTVTLGTSNGDRHCRDSPLSRQYHEPEAGSPGFGCARGTGSNVAGRLSLVVGRSQFQARTAAGKHLQPAGLAAASVMRPRQPSNAAYTRKPLTTGTRNKSYAMLVITGISTRRGRICPRVRGDGCAYAYNTRTVAEGGSRKK